MITQTDWKQEALQAYKLREAENKAQEAAYAEQQRLDTCGRFKKFMANLGIDCEPQSNEILIDGIRFRYVPTVSTDYRFTNEHVTFLGDCRTCGKKDGMIGEIVDKATLGAALEMLDAEFPPYQHTWNCEPGRGDYYQESPAERLVSLIREIAGVSE